MNRSSLTGVQGRLTTRYNEAAVCICRPESTNFAEFAQTNGGDRLIVVFCAWLAFLCSFIDRLSWPPILPLAQQELALSQAEAGGFMSIFFLGYLLTQLPGGMLADRFGVRAVLTVSLLLTGSFTLLFAWVDSYELGLLLRFLAGLGSGAILAAAVKGVYDSFLPKYRATAMGFFMTSLPAGLMLANLISPWIAIRAGWRASFLVAGSLTLMALLVAWWMLPRPDSIVVKRNRQPRETIHQLVRNRRLLVTAAAGFLAMWGTWGVLTWNNSFLHYGMGLNIEESGRMMALFGLGALIGQPLAGKIADRFPGRRHLVAQAILLGFGLLLLGYGVNRNPVWLPLLAPFLGAAAFVFGPVLNTLISELVEADQVGAAIGFCNAVWQLGSLASPYLAGQLLDWTGDYSSIYLMLAGGPLVSVLFLTGAGERRT